MDSVSLADPSALLPYNNENVLQVVIETPKNSRNKYAFDPERHVIVLRKVLPAGMIFPYDFGFVPSTLAEDGDPIDVLLLMEEPAFPGCVLDARAIGVIQGEDTLENGNTQRNDRILAVALASHSFESIETTRDLPEQMLHSMEQFFCNYPRLLSGKQYRVIGTEGPDQARLLIEQARQNASSSRADLAPPR